MKKIITIIAIVLATSSIVLAQDGTFTEKRNSTLIGGAHKTSFGGYIGHGSDYLAHYGALFMDINSYSSNFRTRIHLGEMQRWLNPYVAIEEQYMFPLFAGLYLYPTVGAYSEFHIQANQPKLIGFGFQGGLGLEYQFKSNFGVFVEGSDQYLFGNPNRVRLQVGATFAF